ncbi:hypothetical protein CP061683_0309B, partial [Chlamydia psittaci 06-1683]
CNGFPNFRKFLIAIENIIGPTNIYRNNGNASFDRY